MKFDASSYLAIAAGVLIMIVISLAVLLQRPRRLDVNYFAKKWQELQKLCVDGATWPLAIINADKLLDEALKKRHYKGKTMGERLVGAQRVIRDNDAVWYAHKLRNRLVHESSTKLKKSNVQEALLGVRQALRDLGAIK